MKDGNKSGADRTERPRSPRVPVNFSLLVEGKTPADKPFKIKAAAIKVSRTGATIVIDEEVALGSHLRLTPPFGGKFQAEVNGVWIDERDGRRRIGVKLLDTDGWFAKQG